MYSVMWLDAPYKMTDSLDLNKVSQVDATVHSIPELNWIDTRIDAFVFQ